MTDIEQSQPTEPILLFDQEGYVSYFATYASLRREVADEPLILDEAVAIFDGQGRRWVARTAQGRQFELSTVGSGLPRLGDLRRFVAAACRAEGKQAPQDTDLAGQELLEVARALDVPRPWRPWRSHRD